MSTIGVTVVVFFHILAAVLWIGGMLFLSLVLMPVFWREGLAEKEPALLRTIARQFRGLVWVSVGSLLLTGPILMDLRGIPLMHPSQWPGVLVVKLMLVAVLLVMTVAHGLLNERRAGGITPTGSEQDTDGYLWRPFPLLARLSGVLALAVLFAAVTLVRS